MCAVWSIRTQRSILQSPVCSCRGLEQRGELDLGSAAQPGRSDAQQLHDLYLQVIEKTKKIVNTESRTSYFNGRLSSDR